MKDVENKMSTKKRGRPPKKPGEPRRPSKETLEADRILKETLSKETALRKETGSGEETGPDEETVLRRLSRGPSNLRNYHNTGLKEDEPGKITISQLIEKNLQVAQLPNIDLTDVNQVERRIQEYFQIEHSYGNRPTVAGMAMSLNGMDRRRLWEIVNDAPTNGRGDKVLLPKQTSDTVKKYYAILTNLWEDYMQSGKINPVSGIFLGKNNFGYKDQTEYVLTPNQQPDFNEQQIRDRLSLTGLTDSDSETDSDSD